MLREVNVTKKEEQHEYCDWLAKEIVTLYAAKSMNRKKFMIFMKNFLNEMLEKEHIVLINHGLIEGL